MVGRSPRSIVAGLAWGAAFAATACASLVGIDDREIDPLTSGDDASVLPESGPPPDAAPAVDAAADASDAGGDGAAATVPVMCGATGSTLTCAAPSQVCCARRTTGTSTYTFECGAGGSVCTMSSGTDRSSTLRCAKRDDCPPGDVCCVSTFNGYGLARCRSSCGQGEERMCDTRVAGTCGAGRTCTKFQSQLPEPYGYCN